MSSGLRSRILNKRGIRSEIVPVEALGEDVLVRGLSAGAMFEIQRTAIDEEGNVDNQKLYPAVVIATARDPETDELLFGKADRDALLELGYEVLDVLARKAMQLSGQGKEAAKAIEGNSAATASDASASASPSVSE